MLGVLAVGDAIRPNAAEAVRLLHDAGIRKVVMLSGDNSRTANAIAKQAGIDEAHGDLLPEEKIEQVKRLADDFGSVGMIGDGVNDAPALAAANVGIAMGAAGTDTAIETADVALMRDDLIMVSEAIRLGRRTLGVIRFQHRFRPRDKGCLPRPRPARPHQSLARGPGRHGGDDSRYFQRAPAAAPMNFLKIECATPPAILQ